MNKLFLSLVLLSFGTSVFAQSPQQANPFLSGLVGAAPLIGQGLSQGLFG